MTLISSKTLMTIAHQLVIEGDLRIHHLIMIKDLIITIKASIIKDLITEAKEPLILHLTRIPAIIVIEAMAVLKHLIIAIKAVVVPKTLVSLDQAGIPTPIKDLTRTKGLMRR